MLSFGGIIVKLRRAAVAAILDRLLPGSYAKIVATWREGRPGRRALIVSIHDVAPPFETEVRALLEMLAAIGVRQRVLKVVPDWHGGHPIPQATSFVDLLQSELAAGSELVLHGLEHRRRGALRGPWVGRLRAALFAGDAAEFLTLEAEQAQQAVQEGLDLFAQAGLPRPSAFCAPAWLWTREAERAVRQAGIRHLVGMFSVRDLQSTRRCWLPGFGYMGGNSWHESAARAIGWLSSLPLRGTAVAKVYIHPQGSSDSPLLRATLSRIARMVGEQGWQPTTYVEVCGDK